MVKFQNALIINKVSFYWNMKIGGELKDTLQSMNSSQATNNNNILKKKKT